MINLPFLAQWCITSKIGNSCRQEFRIWPQKYRRCSLTLSYISRGIYGAKRRMDRCPRHGCHYRCRARSTLWFSHAKPTDNARHARGRRAGIVRRARRRGGKCANSRWRYTLMFRTSARATREPGGWGRLLTPRTRQPNPEDRARTPGWGAGVKTALPARSRLVSLAKWSDRPDR